MQPIDPATDFFDLANDLEYQFGELLDVLNTIRATSSAVAVVYPEGLA